LSERTDLAQQRGSIAGMVKTTDHKVMQDRKIEMCLIYLLKCNVYFTFGKLNITFYAQNLFSLFLLDKDPGTGNNHCRGDQLFSAVL
jgi:hypothetical protein